MFDSKAWFSWSVPFEVMVPEAIYDVPAAIFAPCALGGILNDRTVERLSCQIIAGAANNQLEDDRHAELLRQCGIVYGCIHDLRAIVMNEDTLPAGDP